MPLSTTHCMIGSLAGIYLAAKLSSMKAVYIAQSSNSKDKNQTPDPTKNVDQYKNLGEESKMNFETVYKILFWWGITIPCSMGATMVICWVLLNI